METPETSPGPVLLRKYLTEQGMTQKALADVLGVSGPTMHDWLTEAKRPRAEHREAIARATRSFVPASAWSTPTEAAAIAAVPRLRRVRAA